ncbi:MAG: alpha/beta hydrolase [Fimbriimonas sp.]
MNKLRIGITLFLVALSLLVSAAPTGRRQAADQRVSDVIYLKKAGYALTMDVFRPEKPNGIGVIYMVSGGWVSDHNSISPDIAKVFTSRGMTVFEVVHGAQPRFNVTEIVDQIHRAVRFVRANAATYGVDPNRLAITGGSAGGHLSLMMATKGGPGSSTSADLVDRASSEVQSVGIFFPPTDMLNYGKEGVKAFEVPALRIFWPAFGMTTTTPAERAETLGRELSPIYFASAKTPPVLIAHGDADPLVPLQQSQIFIAKLQSLGVKNKLIVVPGGAHGWPNMVPQLNQIADWFEETLKK